MSADTKNSDINSSEHKQMLLAKLMKKREAFEASFGLSEEELVANLVLAASNGDLGDITSQLDALWDAKTSQKTAALDTVRRTIASISYTLGKSYRDFVDDLRRTPEFARGAKNRLDGGPLSRGRQTADAAADAVKSTIKWVPVFYDDGSVAFENMSAEQPKMSPPDLEVLIDGQDAGERVSVDPGEMNIVLVDVKPIAFTLDVLEDGTYRLDLRTS